jgi:hypothetical protein
MVIVFGWCCDTPPSWNSVGTMWAHNDVLCELTLIFDVVWTHTMKQSSVNSHQPQHHCTSSPAPLHLEYAPMPYAPPTIYAHLHLCISPTHSAYHLHLLCCTSSSLCTSAYLLLTACTPRPHYFYDDVVWAHTMKQSSVISHQPIAAACSICLLGKVVCVHTLIVPVMWTHTKSSNSVSSHQQ